jgi:hypothetical protein
MQQQEPRNEDTNKSEKREKEREKKETSIKAAFFNFFFFNSINNLFIYLFNYNKFLDHSNIKLLSDN